MRHLVPFVLAFLWAIAGARAEGPCQPLDFEGASYTVCRFDLAADRLALYDLDAQGNPYGSFTALRDDLEQRGQTLVFAMNAGMYDDGLRPIGLYVEQGRQLKKINRRDGAGNFHLKPNGVFFIKGRTAGVLETEAYLRRAIVPDFATQSGPMLVIDGVIHPKFSETGTSLKLRNGVGAIDDRHVVFAISEEPVNFHSFARLFHDALACPNALFLDGTVSSLYAPDLGRNDGFFPLGPMVGLAR
jgi:uncharacterized protein YigE (DUF2233 family)